MSVRFSIDADPALIEQHIAAYLITTEILRNQSQPILLVGGDQNGLAFNLRVNLNRQQCERLIVREINDNLPGYECTVEWETKTLSVARNARKTSRKKPAAAAQPATAGGGSGGDPI